MSSPTDLLGYLLFMDKKHAPFAGFRRAQFRHVALIEQDARDSNRWILRQWRNHREMVQVVLAEDFRDHKGERLDMLTAIKEHRLDADMSGEPDADVQIAKVSIPQVRKRKSFVTHRATDVGYVKARLGMGWQYFRIRNPHGLYQLFTDNGPDAVEKTRWRLSLWSALWLLTRGSFKLARKAG